ncbi:MAG: tetratricopeptide repeat protein [Minisyncoccota bacterium]
MWYLIIPPIIVVFSLAFVLWYLSRKSSDPFVVAKTVQKTNDATQLAVSFRVRNFLLYVLEKMMYRFKVLSLRMHNVLNVWIQSLKTKRGNTLSVEKEVLSQDTNEAVSFRTVHFESQKNNEHITETSDTFNAQSVRSEAMLRQREKSNLPAYFSGQTLSRSKKHQGRENESTIRPMISEKVTHPEISLTQQRVSKQHLQEDDLIARIAINPKDLTAYESLGDYYFEQGNIKDAKECYRQVLKLSPVHRVVKIKIRRIERLLS